MSGGHVRFTLFYKFRNIKAIQFYVTYSERAK